MSDLRRPDEPTSRAGRLDRVLSDLLAQAPEIEAAAVVSFDGLPMVSALPPSMDEDRVAAMSAALLSLGERAAEGLGRGELSQVYIEGESGTVFLISCDNEAVLVAVAAAGAKAGLMLYEVRRASGSVAAVLREDDAPAAVPPAMPAPSPVTALVTAPPVSALPLEPVYAEASAADGQAPDAAAYAPLAGFATEPAAPAVNGSPNGNGWSSYAQNGNPGEPAPWS